MERWGWSSWCIWTEARIPAKARSSEAAKKRRREEEKKRRREEEKKRRREEGEKILLRCPFASLRLCMKLKKDQSNVIER
jgi:predicted aconitase